LRSTRAHSWTHCSHSSTHVARRIALHVASVNASFSNVASDVFRRMWSDLSNDLRPSVKALNFTLMLTRKYSAEHIQCHTHLTQCRYQRTAPFCAKPSNGVHSRHFWRILSLKKNIYQKSDSVLRMFTYGANFRQEKTQMLLFTSQKYLAYSFL